MAIDYIYLSPTPTEESCAQVGEPDYRKKATKEMTTFINQLYRTYPHAQDMGVFFRIKWQNHDFGQYGEIVATYDVDDNEAIDYALHIERTLPEYWDSQSIMELEEK